MLPDFNYSSTTIWFLTSIKSSIEKNVKNFDASNLPTCKKKDTKDADEDIQYHHWIDEEILNFNDDDNKD
ncbi:hypothetical protein TNCV_4091981 [Trichonephila clavipes]|nr:hypothetical protein TNCV_4091981 [Trichonephila clavipes]